MRCEAIAELLALHLDGALDADAARAVESHVAACPACAAALESLRATVVLLHGLAPAPMPDGLPRAVIDRLATAAGEPRGELIRLGLNRPSIRIALAAGLLIMASIYVVNRATDDDAREWAREPSQAPARAASAIGTKRAVPAAPFADSAAVLDIVTETALAECDAPAPLDPFTPLDAVHDIGAAPTPPKSANSLDLTARGKAFKAELGMVREQLAPIPTLGRAETERRERDGKIWQDELRSPDDTGRVAPGLYEGTAAGGAGLVAPTAPPRPIALAQTAEQSAPSGAALDALDKNMVPADRLREAPKDEDTVAVATVPRAPAPPMALAPDVAPAVTAAPRTVTVAAAKRAAVESIIARYRVASDAPAQNRARTAARTRKSESDMRASKALLDDMEIKPEESVAPFGEAQALHQGAPTVAGAGAEAPRGRAAEFPEEAEESARNRRKAYRTDAEGLVVYVAATDLHAFLAELETCGLTVPANREPASAAEGMALDDVTAGEKGGRVGATRERVGDAGGKARETSDPTSLVPVCIIFE